jgi:hypothetical protein
VPRGSLAWAIAFAAATGCSHPQPGVSQTHRGYYTFGFEVSAFQPCWSDERWWVSEGSGLLHERLIQLSGSPHGEIYAEVRGVISERGAFGHLGRYDRDIAIHEVLAAASGRRWKCPRGIGPPG